MNGAIELSQKVDLVNPLNIQSFVCVPLYVISVFLLIRAALSWFSFKPDGLMATMTGFVYLVTDFLILPVRSRLPALSVGGTQLDISYFVVILAVYIVRAGLGC